MKLRYVGTKNLNNMKVYFVFAANPNLIDGYKMSHPIKFFVTFQQ